MNLTSTKTFLFYINIFSGFNFKVLGYYIGDKNHTYFWLKKKLDKCKFFLNLLHNLLPKQLKWRILFYFIKNSKFQNLICTIPNKFLQDFILEIDKIVNNSVFKIIESPLTSEQLIQNSFSVSISGFGIFCFKIYYLAIKLAFWNQMSGELCSNLVLTRNFWMKIYLI